MPLIVDDDLLVGKTAAKGRQFTPKDTFHSDITGTGGNRGRIDVDVHPANPDLSYDPVGAVTAPSKDQVDNETSVRTLITQPLLEPALEHALSSIYEMSVQRRSGIAGLPAAEREAALAAYPHLYRFDVPDVSRMFDVSAHLNDRVEGYRLWLNLEPQTVVLRNKSVMGVDGRNHNTNTTHIRYRTELYAIAAHEHTTVLIDENDEPVLDADGNPMTAPDLDSVAAVQDVVRFDPLRFEGVSSFVQIGYTFDVNETLAEILDNTVPYLRAGRGGAIVPMVDSDEFFRWSAEEYNLYDRLCDAAEVIRTDAVVPAVMSFISQLYRSEALLAAVRKDEVARSAMAPAARQLSFLDNFEVSLHAYSDLYRQLTALDDEGPISTMLIKNNMQLKLNSELQKLSDLREFLPVPGEPDPDHWVLDPKFSVQQAAAITSKDPLAIVVAGAGSGKTTVITERITCLTKGCGVPAENILALSFTNAAADEISERNPGIVSKTIAKMIHEIYSVNYPGHELSTMDTILNSLDIFYGEQMLTNDFLVVFRKLIARMVNKETNSAIIELSAFIEQYTPEVVQILDTIGQTTLELEIMIAYLLIDDFAEPFASPDYLIIDEVQDNSSFQFVYALRYATKHKCSLYLVGDAAQTLYEFRAANPKALNALEGSGVFATYRLSTNYRSNQEILDFANLHLADIEANQYAKIQLQANSLAASTAESFTDTVRLVGKTDRNQKDFVDNLPAYMVCDQVKGFIDEALERDEATAVLCKTRREVKLVEQALTENWPDVQVANLTSELAYAATTFSKFIANFWDQVTCVPPASAAMVFGKQVLNNLPRLEKSPEKAKDSVIKAIAAWWAEATPHVNGWLGLHAMGSMSDEEFFNRLRQSILDHEIRNNAVRTSLANQRNKARKEAQAAAKPKLYVSTIHGVKGMEFDRTIVVLKPETAGARKDEAYKRELYVALTRAKRKELILAGTSTAHPRIRSDYEAVVTTLERNEAAQAADSAYGDPVEITEAQAAAIEAEGDVSDETADPQDPSEQVD